ncbi:MAG: hypothetical protein H0W64_01420 [Gammaproteobacteria bacterium]|nr:hypothetical protein [Gammaproteobacteria bacterium]
MPSGSPVIAIENIDFDGAINKLSKLSFPASDAEMETIQARGVFFNSNINAIANVFIPHDYAAILKVGLSILAMNNVKTTMIAQNMVFVGEDSYIREKVYELLDYTLGVDRTFLTKSDAMHVAYHWQSLEILNNLTELTCNEAEVAVIESKLAALAKEDYPDVDILLENHDLSQETINKLVWFLNGLADSTGKEGQGKITLLAMSNTVLAEGKLPASCIGLVDDNVYDYQRKTVAENYCFTQSNADENYDWMIEVMQNRLPASKIFASLNDYAATHSDEQTTIFEIRHKVLTKQIEHLQAECGLPKKTPELKPRSVGIIGSCVEHLNDFESLKDMFNFIEHEKIFSFLKTQRSAFFHTAHTETWKQVALVFFNQAIQLSSTMEARQLDQLKSFAEKIIPIFAEDKNFNNVCLAYRHLLQAIKNPDFKNKWDDLMNKYKKGGEYANRHYTVVLQNPPEYEHSLDYLHFVHANILHAQFQDPTGDLAVTAKHTAYAPIKKSITSCKTLDEFRQVMLYLSSDVFNFLRQHTLASGLRNHDVTAKHDLPLTWHSLIRDAIRKASEFNLKYNSSADFIAHFLNELPKRQNQIFSKN